MIDQSQSSEDSHSTKSHVLARDYNIRNTVNATLLARVVRCVIMATCPSVRLTHWWTTTQDIRFSSYDMAMFLVFLLPNS